MSERLDLDNAMVQLDRALRGIGMRYAIIGGAAVVLRGYQRATVDIDAVVWNADGQLESIFEALRAEGLTPRASDFIEFAKQYRMILVGSSDSTEVDIAMGLLPFELEVIERATPERINDDLSVPIASPEDLIIMKLIAGRPRDLDDIQRLAELYPKLDRARIRSTVREYGELLDSPEVLTNLDTLIPDP